MNKERDWSMLKPLWRYFKMTRLLVKTNNITKIQELRKYGKILFVSGLTDLVGIETKEEFITAIQQLFGSDNVRFSQTGKMLS
jgi:hypothetical protein